ncbi:tRNA uridine-5-carboxymethylaminomethyl(34) synthesis GTPase MnmE [Anianabacter salinae]|uniref:tRNA uridine-5-carboxymethylaminomethyl(34) synthesis GTPase MnmE n=1 Tax=Anianabacter salinae TaxID=2851023 RepID=UPI00225E2CCE|nr:tRNA uridine-5-carboxymethylaminomethyl(34) synthesis GTPase MnmE [Anianabacter salinae]MBV0913515.1 tRNA uridine-5-carboxymethylaminomethyl(34) synthesis GTPase MnmE [Anianabacter salinae]
METIFAPATARGKAGVAVIRISGPAAFDALTVLGAAPVPQRRASLRILRDGDDILDEALVLKFGAGRSFTGEDVVELQTHGSPAILSAILARLSAIPGFRIAEPGEFTRRALENERLDLAQVEGLSDLIEAETEAQRRQAQAVFSGALAGRVEEWRKLLIEAAALVEVTIDFADEEVPVDVTQDVLERLQQVMDDLRAEIAGVGIAERVRDGFEVAIVGPPNIGKSTLLNALAGRDAAITSEVAGTTRDVIEVRMDLGGLPVTVLDTAGLRETEDTVEAIGVARALERAARADLRVILTDGGPPMIEAQPGDIVLRGKGDVLNEGDHAAISGKTGQGVDALIATVASVLESRAAQAGTATRERHRIAMTLGLGALESAQERLSSEFAETELVAEEIRTALRALESLVGRVDVEHVLGEIFSRFCLGK